MVEDVDGDRGYQTVAVAGNPLISHATGLARGFHSLRSGAWRFGEDLLVALRDVLDTEVDPYRPLFLFVNILDAHTPFEPVPEGLGWLPKRKGLDYGFATGCGPDDLWRRFLRDEMTPRFRARFLDRLTDLYDYGVWRADRSLGKVLAELRDRGRFDSSLRLVVASDHGEFLGEHGLLSHGLHTYEANQRVPLLFYQEGGAGIRAFPEPISALAAHALVSDGVTPDPPLPIEAVATPGAVQASCSQGRFGTHIVATAWRSGEKLSSVNGELQLIDLSTDGEESSPREIDDHELAGRVRELAERARRSYSGGGSEPGEAESNPEVVEALRALGYLE